MIALPSLPPVKAPIRHSEKGGRIKGEKEEEEEERLRPSVWRLECSSGLALDSRSALPCLPFLGAHGKKAPLPIRYAKKEKEKEVEACMAHLRDRTGEEKGRISGGLAGSRGQKRS